jgi:hypothetical protein
MGYILDGKYYKDDPDLSKLRRGQNSTYKQHDHNRQRQDYAKEIIQPRRRDGSPNPDFIQAYPEESKGYGFLPSDEQLKKV